MGVSDVLAGGKKLFLAAVGAFRALRAAVWPAPLRGVIESIAVTPTIHACLSPLQRSAPSCATTVTLATLGATGCLPAVWPAGVQVAGWRRGVGKLQHWVVYRAGHMVPRDQPVAARQMLEEWALGVLEEEGGGVQPGPVAAGSASR